MNQIFKTSDRLGPTEYEDSHSNSPPHYFITRTLLQNPPHAGVWHSHSPLDEQQLIDLAIGKEVERPADLLGDEVGLAIGLEGLHQPLGMSDRIGPADDAVIAEQDGVVILDKGQHRLGKGLGAGS